MQSSQERNKKPQLLLRYISLYKNSASTVKIRQKLIFTSIKIWYAWLPSSDRRKFVNPNLQNMGKMYTNSKDIMINQVKTIFHNLMVISFLLKNPQITNDEPGKIWFSTPLWLFFLIERAPNYKNLSYQKNPKLRKSTTK